GTSGWLQQEFRELEILDDVMSLHHQGKLNACVEGDRRNTVIREYQKWKGTEYVPLTVHCALKWSKNDPLHLLEKSEDEAWTIIDNKLKKASNITFEQRMDDKSSKRRRLDENYITAKGSQSLTTLSNDNRKLDRKGAQLIPNVISSDKKMQDKLFGVKWDSIWWSCPYDSIIVILHNMWKDHKAEFQSHLMSTPYLNQILQGFTDINHGIKTL
ncbi:hypothetical protein K439DRAFT_1246442, partial [Ramaria rubella]